MNRMRYVSTRGAAPALDFQGALLTGLAADGGLYLPETWPSFDAGAWTRLSGQPYAEVASSVLSPFLGGFLEEADLAATLNQTYARFRHEAVAPLVQIGPSLFLLELFHGPTFAFKDYALQLLGRLFDAALARTNTRVTVLGATSGDTGSAAIEACRDRAAIDVVILYPHGRVSEIQRRQMTTVGAANVHVIAVEGSFDDAQDIVKRLFGDPGFNARARLAAINSINWARIIAQTVYYAAASLALGAPDRPIRFAVPTGNFGNVYSGLVAKRMGLPIERFVVATNRNDIVAKLIATGSMRIGAVAASLSPSMDIQVSSNVERLLFDLVGRDGAGLAQRMREFRDTGSLALSAPAQAELSAGFEARAVDDAATLDEIRTTYAATGIVIDPHTAVGLRAARMAARDPAVPMVALACAHPAKFSDAVRRAIGRDPEMPEPLAALAEKREYVTVLPADASAVARYIETRVLPREGY